MLKGLQLLFFDFFSPPTLPFISTGITLIGSPLYDTKELYFSSANVTASALWALIDL